MIIIALLSERLNVDLTELWPIAKAVQLRRLGGLRKPNETVRDRQVYYF